MSLPRTRRLLVPLLLALAVAAMAAGCSKKDPIPPPPDIPEADVDDIAQHIAAMTASDNGGWFFTVQVMAESLAAPIPASPGLVSRGGRFRTLNTFSRTQAGVTHDWRLGYFDELLAPHPVRDSAVAFIDAGVSSDGGTLIAAGLSTATYGLFADSASGQYSVEFVEPASDTVQFDIFLEDSSFALVASAWHTGSQRLWYQTNLISTTDNMLLVKAALPSPYPVAGALEWTIDAKIMSSQRRDDFAVEWLAEGEMTFDGTQNAILKITVGFGLGSPVRSYRVNLKTGAITKL